MADAVTSDLESAPLEPVATTADAYGSILLEDHHLVERLAQFNRERVPERHPYAKGGGAIGRFEVTNDVSAYTRADVFQPGRRPRCSSGSPPSLASAGAQTPGDTPGASPFASTRPRGTTTWSATTRRSSSFATR